MAKNTSKQTQFELFPESTENSVEPTPTKSPHLWKDFTLSIENIIVMCIMFVMAFVLIFSVGVEKGKSSAQKGPKEKAKKVVQVDKKIHLDINQNNAILSRSLPEKMIASHHVSEKAQKDSKESVKVKDTAALDQEDNAEDREILNIPIVLQDKHSTNQSFYTIQVASFKLEKNARKEAQALEKFSKDIFVLPKGNHSIVCVGKFSQKKKAKEFSVKLKDKYGDCLVRRL